ncbi:MAG TPA: hypothetical protein VF363_00805 [Candidatus Eisenbacteria bacterium]
MHGLCSRFPADASEDGLAALRPLVLARGHLTRPEFLTLCAWKSPRSKPRCRENSTAAIHTLTRAALAASDEALKIDLLRLLRGVEWPTASVILHFCDARPYPILDVRALWSLGYAKPPRYTMQFWLAYVDYTRGLAERLGLSMRTLDKALWQYSKERQR